MLNIIIWKYLLPGVAGFFTGTSIAILWTSKSDKARFKKGIIYAIIGLSLITIVSYKNHF